MKIRGRGIEGPGRLRGMAQDFATWFASLQDPADDGSGELGAGCMDVLRATFDAHGPVSRETLDEIGAANEVRLARDAVALFRADVEHTLGLNPPITMWRNEDRTLVIAYNGNYTVPVFFACRAPEAVCEVADNLRDHVVDHLSAAWPVCPLHDFGLDPRTVDGQAVWFCRPRSIPSD